MSRHTRRMQSIERIPAWLKFQILSALTSITILDRLLSKLGANKYRMPTVLQGDWADQMSWTIDSAVAATRLLLAGQILGASIIVRNQLEWWTMVRSASADANRRQDEGAMLFMARIWSLDDEISLKWQAVAAGSGSSLLEDHEANPDEPSLGHSHVWLSDGTELCPAVLYGMISEIIHARQFVDGISWDAEAMPRRFPVPDGAIGAVVLLTDTLKLLLRQVRLAIASHPRAAKLSPNARTLLTQLEDTFSSPDEAPSGDLEPTPAPVWPAPDGPLFPKLPALMPLLPKEGLSPEVVEFVHLQASVYQGVMQGRRPAGRLFRDDELTTYAFYARRFASILGAKAALESERRLLGDAFMPESLSVRATRWTLAAEPAGLVAIWHPQPEVSASAGAIASGIRSAWWLWLEDDDRAMAVLRSVLEQTARMRVWRTKPGKAAKLEARTDLTTPRDWIETAGWKRLGPLNTALGEFSHVNGRSKWTGARTSLSILNDSERIERARGDTLDFVVEMAASELLQTIESMSSKIGGVLGELFQNVGLVPADSSAADQKLNHIWSSRLEQLMPHYDFTPPKVTDTVE